VADGEAFDHGDYRLDDRLESPASVATRSSTMISPGLRDDRAGILRPADVVPMACTINELY